MTIYWLLRNSYTIVCTPVRGTNPLSQWIISHSVGQIMVQQNTSYINVFIAYYEIFVLNLVGVV